MDEITSVFVQECREQLAAMEAGLLHLEQNPNDEDNINSIFRAAHTIKGGAGVIECGFIEAFTHHVENVLDALRNGDISVSVALATLLLESCDHMAHLVDLLATNVSVAPPQLQASGAALSAKLHGYLDTGSVTAEYTSRDAASHAPLTGDKDNERAGVQSDSWHISVRFGENVLRGGMDPLSFIRYLGSLGQMRGIQTLTDAMPAAADMDPESCYLGFEVCLQSPASKAEIEQVFDFVRDDCDLHILPPSSTLSECIKHIQQLPEDPARLAEILVRCGTLTRHEMDQGLRELAGAAGNAEGSRAASPSSDEVSVEQKTQHTEAVDAGMAGQHPTGDRKAKEMRLVRVHADKLDQLIDLVGELVIAGASANLLSLKHKQSDLMEATSVVSRLVESIRDAALELRMVPIGDTFTRFNRVVRDVAKELGKEIELVINGAETELDKTVVEKIGDPLLHLIRNSLDHGIEPIAVRLERGKPACGRVTLNAFHDSGSIVIQISDDGGGLNKQKILAKAEERGIIQAGQTLSDGEIFNLIFEPGFSTVDVISSLSGRGVGMDVVRRNIQSLRGSVDVASVDGGGATFTIRLPLTLAIIDGFLVGVNQASYVIPLDTVVECVELRNLPSDHNFLNLRGEALPFIRLRELFDVENEAPARESVVVVQFGGQQAGIVVDQLLGEFQTVIKPLGAMFPNLCGIGGSTILGSGEVALILDVAALVQTASQSEAGKFPHKHDPEASPAISTISSSVRTKG